MNRWHAHPAALDMAAGYEWADEVAEGIAIGLRRNRPEIEQAAAQARSRLAYRASDTDTQFWPDRRSQAIAGALVGILAAIAAVLLIGGIS